MLSVCEGVWDVKAVSVGAAPTYRVSGFDDWRRVARRLLDAEMSPEEVAFLESERRQQPLAFGDEEFDVERRERLGLRRYVVPKAFMSLARLVGCHQDAMRWTLLYRLLWRLTHGEPRLLLADADEDVVRARAMEKQVERDAQRMKAAVRFRQVERGGEVWFVAWHRTSHRVSQLVAPFFVERFAAMRWMICTPEESLSWDGGKLAIQSGRERGEFEKWANDRKCGVGGVSSCEPHGPAASFTPCFPA